MLLLALTEPTATSAGPTRCCEAAGVSDPRYQTKVSGAEILSRVKKKYFKPL